MTAPRRPFYRRKRWLAAGLLSLVIAYPASVGPMLYAYQRGWLPGPAYSAVARPFDFLYDTPLDRVWRRYTIFWLALGNRHAESD